MNKIDIPGTNAHIVAYGSLKYIAIIRPNVFKCENVKSNML